MKHCSTMYSRLTINFLNYFKCFCGIKTGIPAKMTRCMLFNCFSITIYNTDKTDKLHHIVNMYLTVNGSGWNLACVEVKVYWQTSPGFMKKALLVLCFPSVVAKLIRQTLYLELFYQILENSDILPYCWKTFCYSLPYCFANFENILQQICGTF